MEAVSERFFELAVDAPLTSTFTYKSVDCDYARGESVLVPFGKRLAEAVVLREVPQDSTGKYKVKNILEKNTDRPILPDFFLSWMEWLAKYYCYPIGQVTKLAHPPLRPLKSPRKSQKSPVVPSLERSSCPTLTHEQNNCIQEIRDSSHFQVHLLHGVTGSGKTEVYLHLIDEVLSRGQTALVLVPEISLTPQLLNRFSSRFPDKVAVIHSHLTDREKTNQWWLAHSQERPILLGARSALFCPRDNLGLIVVDEEHEPSYKQDEKLKYHARDAAIMLAKYYNCPVLLGSATPSLETWENAQGGRYKLHQMSSRVSERPMPNIEIVTLKKDESSHALPFWLSQNLHNQITEALGQNHQVALFLNRRGVAQYVQCFDCGFVYECPNCEISLTLHGKQDLVCHYCNYTNVFKEKCPDCLSEKISAIGLGTEQVEVDTKRLFPGAKVQRADRDEIGGREQMEDLISKMENHEIDILIGTQMIAKGLDFPALNMVGLILADVGFHIPDFRASERSFQLITQVAGRAGRHSSLPGKVIVQTFSPTQPCLNFALNNDYTGFASFELEQRKELNYPPFGKLALIRLTGNEFIKTRNIAMKLQARIKALKEYRPIYQSIQILGPSPAPITKLRNKYRFHILLKSPKIQWLHAIAQETLPDFSKGSLGVKVQIDIDPYNML